MWTNGGIPNCMKRPSEAHLDDNHFVNHHETRRHREWACAVMEEDHIRVDWKMAIIIAAALFLAGAALGFFLIHIFPFETTADAVAREALINQELSTDRMTETSHDSRISDLEKSRAQEMGFQGATDAKLEEILRQLALIQQSQQQQQHDAHEQEPQ